MTEKRGDCNHRVITEPYYTPPARASGRPRAFTSFYMEANPSPLFDTVMAAQGGGKMGEYKGIINSPTLMMIIIMIRSSSSYTLYELNKATFLQAYLSNLFD